MSDVLVLWDLDLTLLDPAGFGTRMITPALADLLGRDPVMGASFAGRTDRAILTDLLEINGIGVDDDEVVLSLMDAVARRCETFGEDLLAGGGGPLPGAHEAVAALAADPRLHQGIVTGNMRRTALLKLRLCGFDGLPDPGLGAFGDHHADRAHLVRDALAAARARGVDVTPGRSVVVGDHVHDVRGARAAGAVCVAVATGRVSADDLRAAGAHTVLPDLTDPDALLAAVHASV
ncbi:haloacid dehalogenase [Dietzia alimentaria]|uniref:HAD hydrolase-like protein n=1 Tax=Dietzia TaxID=37914 RepID=UPI000848A735|nr:MULTISPECIES: HAD hydrolase-like protein [Dietzia]MCZ4541461.1 haloacid dehalogenase-like hydrolase [Dietzia maris]MCZ4655973.1 haloacid dehalogenase-like hydrolase [Dietzia kunjamensis]MDV3354857.1 haloacid dehalogenase-like hydrolase [Dietzia sp. IN118]ODQ83537.1 haloacid dehalogenase [Dietzia alimentaria]